MTCYMSLTHSTVGSISQMDTFFAGFLGRLVTVALSAPYKYSYLLTYLLTYVWGIQLEVNDAKDVFCHDTLSWVEFVEFNVPLDM